jgi:uncharacterized protein (TIGR03067 family)
MHGLALAFLGLALAADAAESPGEIFEIDTRHFAMPLRFEPSQAAMIERVRLFVSEDRGKTWKALEEYRKTDENVTFMAARDGLYYFTLQILLKDGTKDPMDLKDAVSVMKVRVNTQGKERQLEPAAVPGPAGDEQDQLRGTWRIVTMEYNGNKVTAKDFEERRYPKAALIILRDKVILGLVGGESIDLPYRLDTTKDPHWIDLTISAGPDKGKVLRGIYHRDGEELKFCHGAPNEERPREFATRAGTRQTYFFLKRSKPE